MTVSIAVAPEHVPTDLATGSHVDVWVVGEDRRSGRAAELVLDDIVIIDAPVVSRLLRHVRQPAARAGGAGDRRGCAGPGARRERGQPGPRRRSELIAVLCVVLLAAGEAWESPALADLEQHRDIVVLKRCVDVDDLLASVTNGQADVAVVSLDAPGLDPSSILHLRRHAVRPVAVTEAPVDDLDARERAQRLGIRALVADARPRHPSRRGDHGRGRRRHPRADRSTRADRRSSTHPERAARAGSSWCGAPLARRGAPRSRPTSPRPWRTAVHARSWSTSTPTAVAVAQQLGILDEVSGLLSASRLAGAGTLEERFATVCRGVGDHLEVVTGLPRADRWREVRGAHVERLLETARTRGDVVVDTGFSLEDDAGSDVGGRPGRNTLTLTALDAADEVVVVGAADPVGLARLARALVELRERGTGAPVRVVVNRMRASIGWSEKDIAGMVEGFSRVAGLHFLPDDRAVADRALVTGRALVESGDGSLVRCLGALADAVFPATVRRSPGGEPARYLEELDENSVERQDSS